MAAVCEQQKMEGWKDERDIKDRYSEGEERFSKDVILRIER